MTELQEKVHALTDRELQEAVLLELIAIREVVVEEHMSKYHAGEQMATRQQHSWLARMVRRAGPVQT